MSDGNGNGPGPEDYEEQKTDRTADEAAQFDFTRESTLDVNVNLKSWQWICLLIALFFVLLIVIALQFPEMLRELLGI